MKTIRGRVVCEGAEGCINPKAVVRVGVWAIDTEDEVKTLASVYPPGVTQFPFDFSIDVDEAELGKVLINSISVDVSVETEGRVDYKVKAPYTIAEQTNDGSVRIKDSLDIVVSPLKRL